MTLENSTVRPLKSSAKSRVALLRWFSPVPVWQVCLGLFVLAWIGQFIGHQIEGQKPSFLKYVFFLLIGPAWLMSKLYKKAGQRY